MAKTPESAMLIRTPGASPEIPVGDEEPMTRETQARLHVLCERTGEPFPGNITEREAQRRIAALEEIDDL